MRSIVGTSIKNSFIYGLGNMAVKLVGFILIPIYTDPQYFSISEFGILGILDISSQVLLALVGMAIPQSLSRWYWDKDFQSKQKQLFFLTLTFQMVVSAGAILLLLPFTGVLSDLLFNTETWESTIRLVVIAASLQAINACIITVLKLQSKASLYSISNIVKLAAVLGMTIYFVVGKGMGLNGIFLAQAIGNGLFILLLAGYIVKNTRISFELSILSPMLGYGLPLLIAGISNILLNVIDRYSLNYLSALRNVALYTLAFKIASLVRIIVIESIKMATAPMILKKMNDPDNDRFFSKVLLYTSFGVMFCIIGISLFSQELIKLISNSSEYWEAITLTPILALALFFVNLKEITIYGLVFTKKTRLIGLLTILTGGLNLVLNILLIPKFNTYGAAAATLLSQIIFWGLIYFLAQRNYPIAYDLKRIFLVLIVGIVYASSFYVLKDLSLGLRLALKSALLISYPIIFLLFNFYEPIELQTIRHLAWKWLRLRNLKTNIKDLFQS